MVSARSRSGVGNSSSSSGRDYQPLPEDFGADAERGSEETKKQRYVAGSAKSKSSWGLGLGLNVSAMKSGSASAVLNNRKVLLCAIALLVTMLLFGATEAFTKGETALRIVVFTVARPISFKRLVTSLQRAEYEGDRIDIEIYVSPFPKKRMGRKPVDEATVDFAKSFTWAHGSKTVRVYNQSMDLAQHVLHLEHDSDARLLLLQDNVVVSPYFWPWLRLAHKTYVNRVDVAGFTLTRMRQRRKHKYTKSQAEIFMSPLIEHMCAYSPLPRHWEGFRAWAKEFLANRAAGTKRRKKAKQLNLSALHLKYAFHHKDKQTVFANLQNQKTLATRFSENNSVMGRKDFSPLELRYPALLRFPAEPPVVAPTGQIRYYYEHPEMFPGEGSSTDAPKFIETGAPIDAVSGLSLAGETDVQEQDPGMPAAETVDSLALGSALTESEGSSVEAMDDNPVEASSEDPDFAASSSGAEESSEMGLGAIEAQAEESLPLAAEAETLEEPRRMGGKQTKKRKKSNRS